MVVGGLRLFGSSGQKFVSLGSLEVLVSVTSDWLTWFYWGSGDGIFSRETRVWRDILYANYEDTSTPSISGGVELLSFPMCLPSGEGSLF